CVLTIAGLQGAAALDSRDETDGWESASPRDEIRPAFEFRKAGGPNHAGSLIIRADDRAGLDGHWAKAFPIQGGQYYRFRATQRARADPVARRTRPARPPRRAGSEKLRAGRSAGRGAGVPGRARYRFRWLDRSGRHLSRSIQGRAGDCGVASALGFARASRVE